MVVEPTTLQQKYVALVKSTNIKIIPNAVDKNMRTNQKYVALVKSTNVNIILNAVGKNMQTHQIIDVVTFQV